MQLLRTGTLVLFKPWEVAGFGQRCVHYVVFAFVLFCTGAASYMRESCEL